MMNTHALCLTLNTAATNVVQPQPLQLPQFVHQSKHIVIFYLLLSTLNFQLLTLSDLGVLGVEKSCAVAAYPPSPPPLPPQTPESKT